MPKDTREPQEILAHITSSRVALTSAIYGLSEAEMTTWHPVGKWSVKDVMAHIGRLSGNLLCMGQFSHNEC